MATAIYTENKELISKESKNKLMLSAPPTIPALLLACREIERENKNYMKRI